VYKISTTKLTLIGLILFWLSQSSSALVLFDPITFIAGNTIPVAMDVRSMSEVKNDIEIDALASKALLENKGDSLNRVTVLVFSQHVVLAGIVNSEAAKRKAIRLIAEDKRIRSLQNKIILGGPENGGSFMANLFLEKKIGLALTATQGVHSVNMRWKAVGGNVVLMGVVSSQAEVSLAVSKVKEVDGVKSVKLCLRVNGKEST
jgi:osmotically-inducible protein OsmY